MTLVCSLCDCIGENDPKIYVQSCEECGDKVCTNCRDTVTVYPWSTFTPVTKTLCPDCYDRIGENLKDGSSSEEEVKE